VYSSRPFGVAGFDCLPSDVVRLSVVFLHCALPGVHVSFILDPPHILESDGDLIACAASTEKGKTRTALAIASDAAVLARIRNLNTMPLLGLLRGLAPHHNPSHRMI
jgi:hypothetical protein